MMGQRLRAEEEEDASDATDDANAAAFLSTDVSQRCPGESDGCEAVVVTLSARERQLQSRHLQI